MGYWSETSGIVFWPYRSSHVSCLVSFPISFFVSRLQPAHDQTNKHTRCFPFPLSLRSFYVRVCSPSLDSLARSCPRSAIVEMEGGSSSASSFPKVRGGAGGGLFSLGAPAFSGGHSASTSGSSGSPSSRSEIMAMTPASENTLVSLNHLDIHGDIAGTPKGAVR